MTDRPPPLDAEAMLRALDIHEVRYVVIGGVAGLIHGDVGRTDDLDITPDGTRENLGRLARALDEIGARLRVEDQSLDWPLDERAFERFTTMTLRTDHGDLDVVLRPDAPKPQRFFDFESLDRNAEERRIFGLRVRVASLDDVIASKTAAGRPKDLESLRRLDLLRQRLARGRDRDPSRDLGR